MARRPNPRTPTVTYKGVTIRLYRHRDGWKATFQLHGHKRRECYGPTQAAAQKVAETAVGNELDPHVWANRKDEEVAREILKDHGISLTESAREVTSNRNTPTKKITVTELRQLLLKAYKNEGHHHRRSLEDRTRHFENAFPERQISSITRAEVVTWLLALKSDSSYSGRSVRNIYDATKTLFSFARDGEFLHSDRLTVIEQIKRPRAEAAKKEIYTPEIMQSLLDAAWASASRASAALVITAFSAIRSEELSTNDPEKTFETRLCWEDFKWKENFIYVRDETAKGGRGRPVPIRANLRQMLGALKGKGPIYPHKRLDLEYAKIAQKAGVIWKANAPRHSAITYDMLLSNSPAEVANRSGNSVQTIETNYRNRGATKAQAKAWFKLMPKVK